MVNSILFWGKIFETEFLIELSILNHPESENHIFHYLSMCEFVISILQRQMTEEVEI